MALPAKNSIERLKTALSAETVQQQFKNALADNSGPFVASVIDLVSSDTNLQKCEPSAVIMECLKAATLKLPINKSLGFAYVIPYGNTPQFQLGYKGYIQLAQRTGQYKYLNAGVVHEGQVVREDLLTGETTITGEATSEKIVGFFAYMETLNGFRKTVYMTTEKVQAHGKKFSKTYNMSSSPWKTNFEAMAKKTVVIRLLSKWGIMSIEMQTALTSDIDDQVAAEINQNANRQPLDISDLPEAPLAPAEESPGEAPQEQVQGQLVDDAGPGY